MDIKNVTTIDDAIDIFSDYKMFSIDKLKVIMTPQEYYNYLLNRLEKANVVYMACLVFETEEKGKLLLEMILNRMRNNKYTIVLVDKSRNERNKPFLDYIEKNDMRKIFKMVDVNNWKIFPNIINEVLGVYHLKAYVFDDEVCISGANIAEPYFTNRIDRYFVIKNKKLANFVYDDTFRKYSDKLDLNNNHHNNDKFINQKSKQIKNKNGVNQNFENTLDGKTIKCIEKNIENANSFNNLNNVNKMKEKNIFIRKNENNDSVDEHLKIIDAESVEKKIII